MDIWKWVTEAQRAQKEAGQHRLAQVLDRLPELVCNDQHAEVDALYPEALALAKAAKNPWLEVFVRHWYLQSKVLHRGDVADATAAATELLDLAHREETRLCPQSICAVQDFANCYAQRDGPGYTSERLEVAEETLERIDASWPCYRCIGEELADAHLDDGEHDRVLQVTDEMRRALTRHRQRIGATAFGLARAQALAALGRHEEALKDIGAWDGRSDGPGNEHLARSVEARLLAQLGRLDEATDKLPDPALLLRHEAAYSDWAAALGALVSAGATTSSVEQSRALWTMHDRLRRYGRHWDAAELCAWGVELAVARGAPLCAKAALARLTEDLVPLRKPEAMKARAAALAAAVDAVDRPAVTLAPSAAEVLDDLSEDPDRALEQLAEAVARWPDDSRLRLAHGSVLRHLGFASEARRRLEDFVEAHPDDEHALMQLGDLLLGAAEHEAIDGWAARRQETVPLAAAWILGRSLAMRRRWDAAAASLETVLALADEGINARQLLAEVEMARGGFERACEVLGEVVDRVEEPGGHDWARMTAGACCGRWDAVRDSAARLGIELEDGEGPVDDDGSLCGLRFDDAEGVVAGQRRSPVTVRALGMTGPTGAERHGDLVVIDGAPVNLDARDDDEDWIPVFRAVHVLERGGRRTFEIDGPHPGEAAIEQLTSALDALGATTRQRSGDGYQLLVDDDAVPAIYLWTAVPEAVAPLAVLDAIDAATADLDHPFACLHLARATGDDARTAEHLERVHRYSIEL